MNYKAKQANELHRKIQKSLDELVQVLTEIDENSPDTEINEISIPNEDGGTITLSLSSETLGHVCTITSNDLKLKVYLGNDHYK